MQREPLFRGIKILTLPYEKRQISTLLSRAEGARVEHLRTLYRERRLGDAELNARLRALDDLAAGKIKPSLPG